MNARCPIVFIASAILVVSFFRAVSGMAADKNVVHIPHVAGVPYAVSTTCDASAPILDQDTGSLSAILTTDGRFLVAYQDREHGSVVHVAQHVGDHLVEDNLPDLSSLGASPSPQFTLPGPKQGSIALVALAGGKNRIYYTQRVEDETPNEGPYGIWCLEW